MNFEGVVGDAAEVIPLTIGYPLVCFRYSQDPVPSLINDPLSYILGCPIYLGLPITVLTVCQLPITPLLRSGWGYHEVAAKRTDPDE